MSTLERLYSYAKATSAGARENFTTEALAGAIRDDPQPMFRLLRSAGLLPPDAVTEYALDTQIVLPGTGILDIRIVAVVAGRRHELWGEIKVEAGESGTQLDAYGRHLGSIPEAMRPILFILGPHPLRADSTIPFLSWHRLRRSINEGDTRAWRDLADYLAEVRMSDDFDQPVAAREAAALPDFLYLHGKVARIIAAASSQAAERWPFLPWPTRESAVRRKLFDRFASHQQLVVGVQNAKTVWLVFGAVPVSGEAHLMVNVETWPSASDLQREILDLADTASLGPAWQRSLGSWGGLRQTERIVMLGDQDAAAAWILSRIHELAVADILARLVDGGSHE